MSSYVAPGARVPGSCSLGENVVIEDDVVVGENARVGHGVVIYRGTVLGDEVIIEANSVVGRQPRSGVRSRRKTGQEPPLRVGDRTVIGACVVLYAGTVIGAEVLIGDLASVREGCRLDDTCIVGRSVTVECNTVIGAGSRIQTAAHLTGDLVIEENVFIGPEACTMNDKYMGTTAEPMHEGPYIKKDAAIGANSTILPGVTIGRGAVVGAGSVVTRPVPDGETHVGVKAGPIKRV